MESQKNRRTVLVTGASKGIGFAVADRLAREGCRIIAVARSGAALEQAVDRLRSHSTEIHPAPCDLRESGNLVRLARSVDTLDLLVNCAGAIPSGGLLEVSEADWRQSWDLKVFGYVSLCRELYPQLKASGRGVICNVIGDSSELPMGHYVYGSMANTALVAFTRALSQTAIRDGIRVVGVNPGLTRTERMITVLKGRARSVFGDEGRWQELFDQNLAGDPDDIAKAVAFLVSDDARHVNGAMLTVNGGTNGAAVPIPAAPPKG